MNNENVVMINDQNGNTKECRLLALLNREDKNYIVYKDLYNISNNQNLYASRVTKEGSSLKLTSLTDEEWSFLEEEYQKIMNTK